MTDSGLSYSNIEHLFFHLALAVKRQQLNANQPALTPDKSLVKAEPKGGYVVSKNGKVYHTPECVWVNNIKTENRVWLKSEAKAKNKGYKKHDCFIAISHPSGAKRTVKLSHHENSQKELEQRLSAFEAKLKKLRQTNPELTHRLDILETKLEIDKQKLKNLAL
ncbi:hypothetical protein KY320_00630 [Candidatus Woesearchaeota archaeon]|nr:hypothetical protein [Candidatus Woesearchaeota archaeon]